MLQQSQRSYEFGPYRLNPAQQLLVMGTRKIPLTPKAFHTLLVLVENQGRVVSKEELLEKVWPDTFVEEASLTQNVFTLRKQLGDDRGEAIYIETIPKRGYRFVAVVRLIEEREELTLGPDSFRPRPGFTSFLLRLCLAVLAVLLVAGTLWWWSSTSHAALHPQKVMLAVLPVQNLTGNPDKDYISDGMTEEVVARLGSANPGKLGVIARTSSMAYKNTNKTVSQIGHELGVDYILESSIRSNGERLSVTAQLIRTTDQTHIWAQVYDKHVGDILSVQDDVARTVAREIQVSLLSGEAAHGTSATNPDAYDAYLKGRFYWNKRTRESMTAALKYFQEATEKDPDYAPSYAGLSDTYQIMVMWSQISLQDGLTRGRAAAEKAIALDDRLAEAHTSLASLKESFDWDWAGAEAEYKRALDLNPNYATGHHWYAEFLAGHARFEQAAAEMNKALELDPISPVIATTVAEMSCRTGHCKEAIDQYQRVLQMHPGYSQASYLLAEAYARLGRYDEAIAQIDRAKALPDLNPGWASATRAYAAAMSGRRQEALSLLARVRKETNRQYVDYMLATVYASLGNTDEAFASLERARRVHDVSLLLVQADYRLDTLKGDPRFKGFLRQMNF
jgi:TolB-like protein/DNA-binding winged helix-turn-helix (wHTH) protein/Tfp pilus assembly protein PilF